jgi:hypothetical protein
MMLYNEELSIKNKQHSVTTKGYYDIYVDFMSMLRDQMTGLVARVEIFKKYQGNDPVGLPELQ